MYRPCRWLVAQATDRALQPPQPTRVRLPPGSLPPKVFDALRQPTFESRNRGFAGARSIPRPQAFAAWAGPSWPGWLPQRAGRRGKTKRRAVPSGAESSSYYHRSFVSPPRQKGSRLAKRHKIGKCFGIAAAAVAKQLPVPVKLPDEQVSRGARVRASQSSTRRRFSSVNVPFDLGTHGVHRQAG